MIKIQGKADCRYESTLKTDVYIPVKVRFDDRVQQSAVRIDYISESNAIVSLGIEQETGLLFDITLVNVPAPDKPDKKFMRAAEEAHHCHGAPYVINVPSKNEINKTEIKVFYACDKVYLQYGGNLPLNSIGREHIEVLTREDDTLVGFVFKGFNDADMQRLTDWI